MRPLILSLLAIVTLHTFASAQPAPPPTNNTVYHVFVRSFADGDDPDTVGDLKGLTARLDYLNDGKPETDDDLEIGILWLMPIFPSGSYHGYDVTDFESVHPDFGSVADLEALVKAAHERGVRVILDVPFNHTSRNHPWFQEAIANASSPKRGWYHIYRKTSAPDNEEGWHHDRDADLKYFGPFGHNMPDLNVENPDVTKALYAVADFWLAKGVDGFRLDAAKHLFAWTNNPTRGEIEQNNAWWRDFSKHVERRKPGAILVGEVLGDRDVIREHAWGLDGLIDEPFMKETRWFIGHPFAGFVGQYKAFIDAAEAEHPDAPFRSFPYLASHDVNPRLASQLKKDFPGSAPARYRLGLCVLMALGSHPMLYYGDELMQEGWKWKGGDPKAEKPEDRGDGSLMYDETLREPFPWHKSNQGANQVHWPAGGGRFTLPIFDKPDDGISVEEQLPAAASVLRLTGALTNLRNAVPQLGNGSIGRQLTDTGEWLVFERVRDGERPVVVLINATPDAKRYEFNDEWFPEYRGAELLFWCNGQTGEWKQSVVAPTRIANDVFVAPFGMAVIRKS